LVTDEVLKKSTEGKKSGIIWGMNGQLEDLVFADDVSSVTQTHRHAREDNGYRKDKGKVG
jgi:hypothetical protein